MGKYRRGVVGRGVREFDGASLKAYGVVGRWSRLEGVKGRTTERVRRSTSESNWNNGSEISEIKVCMCLAVVLSRDDKEETEKRRKRRKEEKNEETMPSFIFSNSSTTLRGWLCFGLLVASHAPQERTHPPVQ